MDQFIVLSYEDGIETVTWDGYWFKSRPLAEEHRAAMAALGHDHTLTLPAWWTIPWAAAVPEGLVRPRLRLVRDDDGTP